MTILLATDDDNLVRAIPSSLSSTCVVARSALECVDAVRRERPDLLVLDEYLPWGGCDGVLDVLPDITEPRVDKLPILLLTRGGKTPSNPHLRTYRFAREYCGRKLAEVVEMFENEEACV